MEVKDDCLGITETAASEEVRVSDDLSPWRLESFFPMKSPEARSVFQSRVPIEWRDDSTCTTGGGCTHHHDFGETEETVMKRFWMIGLLGILFLAMAGSANAQAPMAGQPYAIPAGYESYSAGTLISYGGYNYVAQDNGTMQLADSQDNSTPADDSVPIDTTAYQIPTGYETSQP